MTANKTVNKDILSNFELGQYKAHTLSEDNETEYLNLLINLIIEDTVAEFNPKILASESKRVARDLKQGLEEADKPLAAFCYTKGITVEEFPEFCKQELMRTTIENRVIEEIAELEDITVTDEDIARYKSIYKSEYARMVLDDPLGAESGLLLAIKTKKTLEFLLSHNYWASKE